ncbi:MAG: transketolase C-terminal domain-containing protein, partial [Pseudonocardiaceae bacterium]
AELTASGEDVTVVDPRWLLPVDPALARAADGYRLVVTVEENASAGGFGDAVARAVRSIGSRLPLRTLCLGQQFLPHAGRNELLCHHDLDAAGIVAAARSVDPTPASAGNGSARHWSRPATATAAR